MVHFPEKSAAPIDQLVGDLLQKPILLGALLVLGTLLLYGPVAHQGFLDYDDSPYVTRNIHVSTGLNPGNVVWAFTSFHEANWHPLTWISHMVDCQLFGLNAGPQHLVNLALHAANVLLLFLLLQRATGKAGRSFFVAALFAVHPLSVETVARIAQRKSLLCTFLSLVTIATYAWYARRPNWKEYLVVVVGFVLALMSKPMAVSLPIVLLLFDYWPLARYEDLPFRRRWVRLSVEKLPLLLMSAASSAVTIVAQRSGGALADAAVLPLTMRLGNAMVSYASYIWKTFWPAKLAVLYPHPEFSPLSWEVLTATVLITALTTAVLYFRRVRYLVTGWFLFLATLIPVIGIVQVGRQAMADRYAYVPCIGLFIIVAWGWCEIVDATNVNRFVPAIAALCLIAGFAAVTSRYLQYWQSGAKLLAHAREVAGRPDSMLEELYADALVSGGKPGEAFQHYEAACGLRPGFAFCHYNMAEILFSGNQLRDALAQYQIAGSLTDNRGIALSCLINSGEILLDSGDYQAAEMKFAAALQIDPGNRAVLQLRQRALNERGSPNP